MTLPRLTPQICFPPVSVSAKHHPEMNPWNNSAPRLTCKGGATAETNVPIKAARGAADICRYTGSRAPRHLCKSLNAEEAVFIRPECFQDGPSSGRVYPCQLAAGPAGTWGAPPASHYITGTETLPSRGHRLAVNVLQAPQSPNRSAEKNALTQTAHLKGPVCEILWHPVVKKHIALKKKYIYTHPKVLYIGLSFPHSHAFIHARRRLSPLSC